MEGYYFRTIEDVFMNEFMNSFHSIVVEGTLPVDLLTDNNPPLPKMAFIGNPV